MNKKSFISIVFLLLTVYVQAHAEFIGPSQVLTTTYGGGDGQIGLDIGESDDSFAFKFAVSSKGKIAICDIVNNRVSLFSASGISQKNINVLSTDIVFDSDDSLYFKAKFRKFDVNGNMVFEKNIGFNEIFITPDDKIIGYIKINETYNFYSKTGQFIKATNDWPLELGEVEEVRAGNNYKIKITYPDKIYSLISDRTFTDYYRIANGQIYGINEGGVWRFNQCGKLVGKVLMPSTQTEKTQPQGKGEPFVLVLSEYGQPVVASNGDVYTWKRTPDKYSILKWTWVDDPNVPTGPDAPSGLTVMPSINGLYLTWKASPNDPGCVTKYEIARATTSGGVFSTIDSVEKGVLKYNDTTAETGTTYYYKVRAMAGSDPSAYTAEVSGKR